MLPVVLLALLSWQSPAAEPPQRRFTSRSDLVVLHVAVVDPKSVLVPGLPREAFTIVEDGHPQTIRVLRERRHPRDRRPGVGQQRQHASQRAGVVAAATRFVKASHPDDEMFTINFNEHVWHGLPQDQPFTSDRQELMRALQRSTARGRTALFDALRTSLHHLEKGSARRRR